MVTWPDYELEQALGAGERATLWRARRRSDGAAALLKIQAPERLSMRDAAMLRHERDMLTRLRALPVLPLRGMEVVGRRAALVFEDVSGQPLRQLMRPGQPMALLTALRLARGVAQALDAIHAGGVVHKKLSPEAIFVTDQGQVFLHEFGLATALSREEASQPHALAGEALPYCSPEQTGRLSRAVDLRSDYYSLGVILFELCVGRLPFEAEDAMGWVHCHIARKPPEPAQLNPELPQVVSAMILRLLSKEADARYPSSQALCQDLARVERALELGQPLEGLALGLETRSGRFELPDALIGRQAALRALLDAFEHAQRGGLAWVTLQGPAGVGKSALMQELGRQLVAQDPYMIQGKFEQYQRNVPYASLIQALRGLIQRLLMEPEEELTRWRDTILSQLGPNVGVIMAVLPELELIVGAQPAPLQILGVSEQHNRFELTFQRFIGLFCSSQRPLILALDDVQWADPASMELLGALLSDPRAQHLLVLCAQRPWPQGDASGDCPWGALVARVQVEGQGRARVTSLSLESLSEEETLSLVALTLDEPAERVEELAAVLRQKTEGNPFFVRELFSSLWEQGHVRFDAEARRWTWQMDAIRQAHITDNVVELLSDKILRLDAQAQRVLQVAACVGGQFELETLSRVLQLPEQQVALSLWQAMREGLLSPMDENYKYILVEGFGLGDDPSEPSSLRVTYRFHHDRVQQAAYLMLKPQDAAALHLAIGRRMIEVHSTQDRHERLFDVVSQLNEAIALMDDPAERLGLAQLNLSAAKRAKASLAYDFARRCAEHGLTCLGEQGWQTQRALMFELSLICAQCDALLSELERAAARFEALRQRCRDDHDRVRVTIDQVELLGHRNEHHEAVRLGLEGLALLGERVAREPGTPAIVKQVALARWARRGHTPESLLAMAPASEERVRLLLQLCLTMAASANFTTKTLFPLLVLKMVNVILRRGHTDAASFAYAGYGLILTSVLGEVEAGRTFGQLALRMADRYEAQHPSAKVRCLFIFGGLINHWSAPALEDVPTLERCVALGMECGDLVYAGYAVTLLVDALSYSGSPLEHLLERTRQGLETLARVRDDDSTRMAEVTHQSALALRGQTRGLTRHDSDLYDEAARAELMRQSINLNPWAIYQTARLKLHVLAGRYEEALAIAQASCDHPEGTLGLLVVPEHGFYHAIALSKRYEHAAARERLALTRQIGQLMAKLRRWSAHSPACFAHKLRLVEALWCDIKRDEIEAQDAFEEAIRLADEADALHDLGLACYLAAEHQWRRGRGHVALAYAGRARDEYARWGATALVALLEQRHPALARDVDASHIPSGLDEEGATASMTLLEPSPARAADALDLATVLKATQALSSEIQLEPLLKRLMHIVLESAGARSGLVMLYDDPSVALPSESLANGRGPRRVYATAHVDEVEPVQVYSPPLRLTDQTPLATKILHYVERTQESVVLEDAASSGGAFGADPYITRAKPRAVLCMPVVHKGAMIGVLYLENNLATGAFTQQRLEVLSVVCTQLAISIEHARMYQQVERARQTLEERVVERTQALERANHDLQFEIAERKRAQSKAVEASQSKSLFLANMSHELRTPLNAIIGYSELIREDMEDMEDQTYAQDVHKILVSAHHLLNLINDILDLSKIEARKMDVSLSQVALEPLLTEVATTARPLIERNHNRFVLRSSPLMLTTDRTKLMQILMNLLSNASKFTTQGTITLAVKSSQVQDRPWVHLEVHDTGIGMSQEQLSRLFQVFGQAEADTQAKYGGTGLGLALSRQLCRLLGGDIHVESVPGQGSTFTVALPMSVDEESLGEEVSVVYE